MKKKIFLILQFLLLSVILSADNAQTYNLKVGERDSFKTT